MGRTRWSFTNEFQLEAVRLLTDGEQSISQVARDLGIRDTIRGRWKKDCEQDREASFPCKGHVKSEEAERRPRRWENERVRKEHDIL